MQESRLHIEKNARAAKKKIHASTPVKKPAAARVFFSVQLNLVCSQKPIMETTTDTATTSPVVPFTTTDLASSSSDNAALAVSPPTDASPPAEVSVSDVSPVDPPSDVGAAAPAPAVSEPNLRASSSHVSKPAQTPLQKFRKDMFRKLAMPSALSVVSKKPFEKFHHRALKLAKAMNTILTTTYSDKLDAMILNAQEVIETLVTFARHDSDRAPVFQQPDDE